LVFAIAWSSECRWIESYPGIQPTTARKDGDLLTVTKKAWEYLWVRYGTVADDYAKKLVKRPTSVHIERVYDSGDFSKLGIGN
jgi:hypothetical protein